MLSNIEKNIKTLESMKTTLKNKLIAYEKAKKDIIKLEEQFLQLTTNNINLGADVVDYNNIDTKLESVEDSLKKYSLDSLDITKLIQIKQDILSCKKFLENENQLKITINDNGNITNITDRIKENALITQIFNDNSSEDNESKQSNIDDVDVNSESSNNLDD